MNLRAQKRMAATLLKTGLNRVWFDDDRLTEVKEAITKADIRALIKDKAIQAKPEQGNSRYRIRKLKKQKSKGRRKGKGSRTGKKTARLSSKESWMAKIRTQRDLIKTLREKLLIDCSTYRMLYRKSKGGFFRSRRHIKLYLTEHGMIKEAKETAKK